MRLRSLFRAKRGISGFASALPRNRFTPRNDTLLNAFVLVSIEKWDETAKAGSEMALAFFYWVLNGEVDEMKIIWRDQSSVSWMDSAGHWLTQAQHSIHSSGWMGFDLSSSI